MGLIKFKGVLYNTESSELPKELKEMLANAKKAVIIPSTVPTNEPINYVQKAKKRKDR